MSAIQDLIVSFNETKDRAVYVKIIDSLRNEEKLWVAFSPVTNNFYLDMLKVNKNTAQKGKPIAFIFSEKEYYNVYEERLKEKNITIKPFESSLEKRLDLFNELYRSGFEHFVVDNGQKFIIMSLFDIIKKPDFSDIPEIQRPVMNPELIASANNFFQALSLKRQNRQLEEKMFKEIYNAKFLVPIENSKIQVESENTSDGKAVIKEDSVMRVPLITNEKNQNFIAIFTDWSELRKFDKEQKFSGNIIGFNDLSFFMSNNDGIVINPFGFNMIMNDEMIKIIEDVATGKIPSSTVKTETAENTDSVSLAEPSDYPKKMIDKIKKCLKKHKEVKSAYLKLMTKNKNQSWLIIIDFEGDKKILFDDVANAAIPNANGIPVAFAPKSTPLGAEATKGSKPFYTL